MKNKPLLYISFIAMLACSFGMPQTRHNNTHAYTTINGDTLQLDEAGKRYKALIFINSRSCTGCKEQLASFMAQQKGYQCWVITRSGLSAEVRRENYWYLKNIFGKHVKDVLFDLQQENDQVDLPYKDGCFHSYGITYTPVMVLLDSRQHRELFIPYQGLFAGSLLSPALPRQMQTFRK